MAEVSPEVWEMKDKRIVKMNALGHAVNLVIEVFKEKPDGFSFEDSSPKGLALASLEVADILVKWIYNGAEVKKTNGLPAPTPEQEKILWRLVEEFAKKAPPGRLIDARKLKAEILRVSKKGTYPSDPSLIPAVLKAIDVNRILADI